MAPHASAPSERQVRCPGCRALESGIAHRGRLFLGAELVDQETRVCLACGLAFARGPQGGLPGCESAGDCGPPWLHGGLHGADAPPALHALDAERLGDGHGRRVHEIGCGCGLLLDELAARGWRTSGGACDGLAALEARTKGHDVSPEPFRAPRGPGADLVVLSGVLGQQSDPLAFLAEVARCLAPEGRLFLRVPDLEAIDFESFCDAFGLGQRVWFTRETLVELLAAGGFEALEHGFDGGSQHVLARVTRARPARRPPEEPQHSLDLIRRYSQALARCRAEIDLCLAQLGGRSVALYGGGEHARALLQFSRLGGLASRVVDGNPNLWGRHCGGIPIESPKALRERPPHCVVVASRAYQDQIAAELADLGRRGVEIVRLYEPVRDLLQCVG